MWNAFFRFRLATPNLVEEKNSELSTSGGARSAVVAYARNDRTRSIRIRIMRLVHSSANLAIMLLVSLLSNYCGGSVFVKMI